MSPLKLTWTLATPMVAGAFPTHLDALIAFAISQEAKQADPTSWDDQGDIAPYLSKVIGREDREEGGCWQASALAAVDPGDHSMRFWTRKSDPYDYARQLEEGNLDVKTKLPLKPYGIKFDQVRGTFKQMFKFYPVRNITKVNAWCIGDADRLMELLAPESGYLTYLGSKTRMGHGRITSFGIEDAGDDEQDFWKNRVLPWQEEGLLPLHAVVEPPYWDVTRQRQAWIKPELLN